MAMKLKKIEDSVLLNLPTPGPTLTQCLISEICEDIVQAKTSEHNSGLPKALIFISFSDFVCFKRLDISVLQKNKNP